MNFGAQKYGRIKKVLSYALMTSAVFSFVWTILAEVFPLPIVYIFMQPSDSVTAIAAPILRGYSLSFIT
jgi:Na+-driven multidrug efflux pump